MNKQISAMKDMVVYQDGSIVSKEIIKKPTGTVTVFAFDQDQGLSEHTAPFDALVYVLDGETEITISGKPHHLKEGLIHVGKIGPRGVNYAADRKGRESRKISLDQFSC